MQAFERAMVDSHFDPTKDVPTSWHATFLMIDFSSPLKLSFQQLSMDDVKFEVCPSSLDWEELAVMKKFLEPFH
jgi:hypothetical protein